MKKQHIKLTETDERYLTTLLSKGQLPARVFRRASALLQLHQGATLTAVGQTFQIVPQTVSRWRDAYLETGLEVLDDQPRTGRPVEFDGAERAKLTALACSTAPDGYAKWSLRLLADKAVELDLCERISHSQVGVILKKPTSAASEKTWCIGEMDSVFIARMERILWLYGLAYDARFPVICYDERPCFLIGQAVTGLQMKAGQPAREHYAYEKNGSCNLLASIEPLTGKRIIDVCWQRRKKEFAWHFKRVAEEFPEAEKIRVVLDNLNTHNASAFYEVFAAEEALALAQKFEFYYTPPKASWLNMIELEFSAISRLCLNRRIPTKEELEREVLAIVKDREEKAIKIEWQFSIEKSRKKLKRHYEEVNNDNSKPNKT